MSVKINSFIEKFCREIKDNNVAIFAGAGLSIPAGYVNWSDLLKPLAEEINIDITKENDLVSLAQYYKNETNSRSEINRIIIDEFSNEKDLTKNHEILAQLPISTYWTTNYDSMIEDSLKKFGRKPDVKYTVNQLTTTRPKRDAVVYKMHGDKNHPDNAIILKEDYEIYSQKYEPFLTALSGDLTSKTFLFIGLSFTDPNLDYILSRVRIRYGENQRTHYAFVKLVEEKECESDVDFHYLKRKQELFINDLKRYNIQPLIISSYSEITSILTKIQKCINKDRVFISGSACEYGDYTDEEADDFIYNLSKRFIKEGYSIVSGFGLGVGSLVISGALEEIYMNQQSINEDQLLLRPFPQKTLETENIQDLWNKYRKDMISKIGIAIFLFGNKISDNGAINANGVYKEFEIAKEDDKIIVPVGVTGYMSKVIWNEVNDNFEKFYPQSSERLRELFNKLNSLEEKNSIIDIIINFIEEAKKCLYK
ncbi:MAG: SIR2 family protein [Terrisporobacter othiniensis]|uniref:SIR2 family protein n=1 Tax=Terrisporobacter othiniensis TaxID=1577792 RepID=UPI002914B921|nr:SIR2 family protein [Terrisporobacter othiniensis]MDU6983665.1 SIR2 family protein [Terrisporobacter othiniensis]